MKKALHTCVIFITCCALFPAGALAQQCIYRAIRNGSMSDPATFAVAATGDNPCTPTPLSGSNAIINVDGYSVTLNGDYEVGPGGAIIVNDGAFSLASNKRVTVAAGGSITVSSRGSFSIGANATVAGSMGNAFDFELGDGSKSQTATNLLLNTASTLAVNRLTVNKATIVVAPQATLSTACNLVVLDGNIIDDGSINVGGNLDLSSGGANKTLCNSSNTATAASLTVSGCVFGGNGATTHFLRNCTAEAIGLCVQRNANANCEPALAPSNTNEASCDASAPSIRCRPLPVELAQFTATAVGGQGVALRWTTALEKNSATFTIERSADGLTFQALRTLPAAGNTQAPTHYEALDGAPLRGTNYYRLRQTDLDAAVAYSPVRAVDVANGGKELEVYPAAQALHWVANSSLPAAAVAPGVASLQVFDLLGRRQQAPYSADPAQPGRWTLDLHAQPVGVYIVRLHTPVGAYSQRIAQ